MVALRPVVFRSMADENQLRTRRLLADHRKTGNRWIAGSYSQLEISVATEFSDIQWTMHPTSFFGALAQFVGDGASDWRLRQVRIINMMTRAHSAH